MEGCKSEGCWKSNAFKIYLSHALSSWGDRMWAFACGLYLVFLYSQSLQLAAVYGLSVCLSVIVFGATLGKWIDKTKRITVARAALIIQNSSVVLCSLLLVCLLYYEDELAVWRDGAGKTALIVSVIVVAVIANLGSEASKIALEKDWIVVLSDGDETKLARMNSTMRTIDLTTFILAPILVGQIITYGSKIYGALFIACWNVVSGVVEYFLLTDIYNLVPQLANKNIPLITINSPDTSTPQKPPRRAKGTSPTILEMEDVDSQLSFDELTEVSLASPASLRSWNPFLNKVHPEGYPRKSRTCLAKTVVGIKNRCHESWVGWKDYFAHPVRGAGIGLALLYMTVLGFDTITTGYAYSQGVSESMVGIVTACGAVLGILGSLSFPYLRKNLGNCKTGVLGFGIEVGFLVLCLVSILAPGSPFIHKDVILEGKMEGRLLEVKNVTTAASHQTLTIKQLWNDRISVVMLLTGIVFARFGLWIADLSVVQIFQEEIRADQRGVLNGVQGSLNQLMNLLKFVIVIILPNPETFAYLICLSWIFVFSGWVSFIIFACSRRKHGSKDLERKLVSPRREEGKDEQDISGDNNNNFK